MDIESLEYDAAGLIPAVVQDAATQEILMMAYMNRESLARTLETGQTWFWSRSRAQLWHKGEESGAFQRVQAIFVDCDLDTLLVRVLPDGPACHTGQTTCFYRQVQAGPEGQLQLSLVTDAGKESNAHRLMRTIAGVGEVIADRRRHRPAGSYTTYLFEKGLDKILKKIGEESAEVIIASKNDPSAPLVAEVSDLIYHLLVLAEERGIRCDEVAAELEARKK